ITMTSYMSRCSMWPVGALHPVRAQLERFEAGPGCAAREGGAKETHVISVVCLFMRTDLEKCSITSLAQ
uniref:Uncharacterized protein n=2 Tax=Cyprinus carpio TaxID=7962 RepID=A0A8C1NRE8_CYPCA